MKKITQNSILFLFCLIALIAVSPQIALCDDCPPLIREQLIQSTVECGQLSLEDQRKCCRNLTGSEPACATLQVLDQQAQEHISDLIKPVTVIPQAPLSLGVLEILQSSLGGIKSDTTLEIEVDGHKIPIQYTQNGDQGLIEIQGKAKPGTKLFKLLKKFAHTDISSCLSLNIDLKKKTGHISILTVSDLTCPLPPLKQGSFLLTLTDKIAQALSLEEISLQDASKVQCPKNSEETSLRMLHSLKGKGGWYESRGYIPYPDEIYQKYLSDLNEFVQYPLSSFSDELSTLNLLTRDQIKEKIPYCDDDKAQRIFEGLKKTSHLFSKKLIEYKESKESHSSEKMSDFLSWLWESNCEEYIELTNFIFGANDLFSISKIYPKHVIELKKIFK